MAIVGNRKVSLSWGGHYESPKCIVIGISDRETLLQTGSVTFNSTNTQPSFSSSTSSSSSGTDDTWRPDEKGDTTFVGLGSDPSANF